MATYTELYNLMVNSDLANKVLSACVIAAEAIRNEAPATSNHANRLKWAKNVLRNPEGIRTPMLRAILGQNAAVTQANILNATDNTIQTNVNAAVDLFADGTDF